ncbi:MAG: MBL fold metallo-hydrolase [Deltaproteobacteria bacterium]|nr:MBL fold metallo-hydrolase [Deltaproteobacteria bacterium]
MSTLLSATGCGASAQISSSLWPRLDQHVSLEPGELGVRWLGAAGFVLRARDSVLMVDPFISRPPLPQLLLGRLGSDEEALAKLPSASLIAVGHSHYDHVMDVAAIARRSKAGVLGSPSVCRVIEAMSVNVPCRIADGHTRAALGPFVLRAMRSEHAKTERGRVPLDGEIELPIRGRHPHVLELASGGVIAWAIEVEGLRILHLGSAGIPSSTQLRAFGSIDVVLAAVPIRGSDVQPYAARLRDELAPSLVIVHHHDSIFGPLTDPVSQRSWSSFHAMMTGLEPVRTRALPPFEEMKLRKRGELVTLSE